MEDRKLAHVERVIKIIPIEKADKLEIVQLLGWECIVQKGQFKEGDLVVYIECDSVCPKTEDFSFLADRKYRIRIIKLRGVYSQGLVMPLSTLPKGKYTEGQDVTKVLKITKYDPQAAAEVKQDRGPIWNFLMHYSFFRWLLLPKKTQRELFPSFLIKTDEERIQNIPWVLEKFKDIDFYASVKVDGHSNTYWVKDGKFGVASRNIWLKKETENDYWKLAREMKIEEKLKSFGKNICIQGEQIGPGIQGNKYNLTNYVFLVFNVFDIDERRFYNMGELIGFCNMFGFNHVYILKETVRFEGKTVNDMVEMAKGMDPMFPNTIREGLVFRPMEEMKAPGIGRVSFKAINPEFLLKHGE
jgi:hypothetical protein